MKIKKTTIIAEAGVNHNGDINLAKKLINIAANSGADYVKFQSFNAENLVSKNAALANYQKKNSFNLSHFNMLKKLQLSNEDHEILIDHCKTKNIKFLSTGFDIQSIDMLINYGIDYIKIPSGEITNYPLLQHVGKKKLPVLMSTGMSTLSEINDAMNILTKNGLKKSNITILHCCTSYPAKYDELNLNAIKTIKNYTNCKVGLSDHSIGIEAPLAAVALGAEVIEKHFTISRKMNGPDHKASIEAKELIKMVSSIRNIEDALGNGIKKPTENEKENLVIVRKSIYSRKKISRGDKFTESNLICRRPANGISSMKWNKVIGRKAKKDYNEDELIEI